ncbi:hypothetical protein CROQUDRAFT_97516 [Cronartium quercuum f. sp. fusiforme G11]|uniref:Uncharacterized protein n=1 Tax=Cronartium quercuum f. sp. fusiforme G11 TaxID=708437 RepID=A0A9P6NB98_9BASI|nr:hypothetical protein CROQUDRAFT_97516 [Cronartium quercuum f. sp. fusiforme G11]
MSDYFSSRHSSVRRKISTGTLRTKVESSSTKAINWVGHQIRKVRRGSKSDDSSDLWGTSTEIYAETWNLNGNWNITPSSSTRFGSADSNVVLARLSSKTTTQRKRKQDKFSFHRMIEPVELYDRPWSGEFRDPFDGQSFETFTPDSRLNVIKSEIGPTEKLSSESDQSSNKTSTKINTSLGSEWRQRYFASPMNFLSKPHSSTNHPKTSSRRTSTATIRSWFRRPTGASTHKPGHVHRPLRTDHPCVAYQPHHNNTSFSAGFWGPQPLITHLQLNPSSDLTMHKSTTFGMRRFQLAPRPLTQPTHLPRNRYRVWLMENDGRPFLGKLTFRQIPPPSQPKLECLRLPRICTHAFQKPKPRTRLFLRNPESNVVPNGLLNLIQRASDRTKREQCTVYMQYTLLAFLLPMKPPAWGLPDWCLVRLPPAPHQGGRSWDAPKSLSAERYTGCERECAKGNAPGPALGLNTRSAHRVWPMCDPDGHRNTLVGWSPGFKPSKRSRHGVGLNPVVYF